MIYQYLCQNKDCPEHKKVFEKVQKITEDKLKTCEHCKKDTLEKVLHTPPFGLKGGGYYGNGRR